MSRENVEAFERGTEAYNRRETDALLTELDPEVEWHSALLIPFGGKATVSRGHDGVREVLGEVYEALDEIHLDYSEIRDLGDRIVGIGRIRTRGRQSGAVTELAFGTVTDMRNGKAIRIWTYLDPQEALEAAGLRG
ncbi:MAG TPA: nuclear transport factor 2 family protein [Solirubrobacterales bacterium]|nr:nuclear transport factor 2 family protein [Solirubrobacterales bacterium]